MKSVCLVMIVKNEALVLPRCFRALLPFIDHWVICDTGSSDATIPIIEAELGSIPGELYRDEWRNFEWNRNLGLARSIDKADYRLLLDADMELRVESDFRDQLGAPGYFIRFNGETDYSVIRLINDDPSWRYIGLTHEYIHSPQFDSIPILNGVSVVHHEDGGCRPEKYQRDLQILSGMFEQEPSNPRTIFYLAQTYRDLGNFEEASKFYFQRAEIGGGWSEEIWYSLYQIALLKEKMGVSWPDCLAAYLQAFQFRPTRLEPIYHVALFYRKHKQFTLGLFFARLWNEIPYPADKLFIQRNIYTYLLPFEYAICCHELGFINEARRVEVMLIENNDVIVDPFNVTGG